MMLLTLLDTLRARAEAARPIYSTPRHWYSGRPIPREPWQWTAEDYAEADQWGAEAIAWCLRVLVMMVAAIAFIGLSYGLLPS